MNDILLMNCICSSPYKDLAKEKHETHLENDF